MVSVLFLLHRPIRIPINFLPSNQSQSPTIPTSPPGSTTTITDLEKATTTTTTSNTHPSTTDLSYQNTMYSTPDYTHYGPLAQVNTASTHLPAFSGEPQSGLTSQ